MFIPGLKGVTAVQTALSDIDGQNGILLYRGKSVQTLVENFTFEEVAYFLLFGSFPNTEQYEKFINQLNAKRNLPKYARNILQQLPEEMELMDVLRTVVSVMYTKKDSDIYTSAIGLIAMIPTVIAHRYRTNNGLSVIQPDPSLGHVENFIYMLSGNYSKTNAKILETYLILTMEHGLNASTFAARVTVSTESDLTSAITSALGTMKGPLHGGAPSGVIALLEEIGSEDRICEIVHNKLERNERIMGFGHRIYKTVDPRAESLKQIIMRMDDLPEWIQLALKTETETIKILNQTKPDRKLYTNVEYYAAAIMKTLDIDASLFTAIFSSARVVGWCAHTIEQLQNNTIFRPNAMYIGK